MHFDDVVEDSEPEREQRRRRNDVIDGPSDAVLELSRFAYSKTTHASSSRPFDPEPTRSASLVRRNPPDNPPDSQLVRLSKCVGCGLEWTSRKTAKQKRTHIKQCAKKHALTKDTVKTLIEKEIVSSHVHTNETTLMDSVVPTGLVKKSKREQVLPTVKSLPETRDSILSRARDILRPTNTQGGPQLTQQFGQSALARNNTRYPKRLALFGVNSSAEEPPFTQPFGASSLRGEIINAELLVDGYREPPLLQFSASLFAQESILTSDCGLISHYYHHKHKRRASPSPPGGDNSRSVRQRLL